MEFREMQPTEVEKIQQIDAENYIQKAWRKIDGKLQLIEIDWTDYELPNGIKWHMERFLQTIAFGGKAYGCFENNVLLGYATLNREMFGRQSKYVLLDQLFVSKSYRGKGIGKRLLSLCKEQAKSWGADKLYIAAGSAENTIAFYKSLGCKAAIEINAELAAEDENDIQLELDM